MSLGELLQHFGSVDEETMKLAHGAVTALLSIGLERDAALAWIDQVCAQPERFLNDPVLAPLADARLQLKSQALKATSAADELRRADVGRQVSLER